MIVLYVKFLKTLALTERAQTFSLPPTLIISRNAIGIGRRRPVTHRYRRQVLKAVERAAEKQA